MRAIGVDLHKNMFQVCILSGKQKEFRRYELREIEKFKKILDVLDLDIEEVLGGSINFY